VDNGLADASLRRLARVAGTSHPHLRYYFGSRTGLLGAVLHALRQRESEQLIGHAGGRRQALLKLWSYFTSPAHLLEMQLFFEVAGAAVQAPADHQQFVDEIGTAWIGPLTALGVSEGLAPAVAERDARACLAALRGLLLERLLTADTRATDDAWSRFVDVVTGGAN
jgi:AcrR family transcriptional regulator